MKTHLKDLLKKCNWPYAVYREIILLREERKVLWKDAAEQLEEGNLSHVNLKDYKKAMRKHRISIKEYDAYGFEHLNEEERRLFLSEKELKCIYRKSDDITEKEWFYNKLMTFQKFGNYMRRNWICPSVSSFQAFSRFVTSQNCIVKPWNGSLGLGIFAVKKDNVSDLVELYENCRNNNCFVEECIQSCKEISDFHPQSLNTVRVMTMYNGEKFEVVGCMFRMGVGEQVVDNGSKGGILANVDPTTGIVVDNGRDKYGTLYTYHPDSGKAIKGFVIPYWNNVICACKEMASLFPTKIFVGWDVAVLDSGEIELIEANSEPNITGLQSSHCYGFRPRIQSLGKELLGYDLMKLISVWSRPRTDYDVYMQYKRRLKDPKLLLEDYVEYISNNKICQ